MRKYNKYDKEYNMKLTKKKVKTRSYNKDILK